MSPVVCEKRQEETTFSSFPFSDLEMEMRLYTHKDS